jgi:hypothetical protein
MNNQGNLEVIFEENRKLLQGINGHLGTEKT